MKQELTPILLPTYTESNISISKKGIFLQKTKYTQVISKSFGLTNQHLYLVDNSKIKESDWFILNNKVYQLLNNDTTILNPSSKKIIATTDKSLMAQGFHTELPQIPQDFIKYFIEKQGNVGKVWIEMEGLSPMEEMLQKEKYVPNNTFITKPKLTKDNEVIIVLEEKSYTRDEMIAFGQKCGTAGTMAERIGEDFNHLFLQLVEQNL